MAPKQFPCLLGTLVVIIQSVVSVLGSTRNTTIGSECILTRFIWHTDCRCIEYGLVSCTQRLACEIGVETLRAGGNALEATISVQLALAVVEPQHVSLLGGGALVSLESRGDIPVFLDFREEAPSHYHPRTFCKDPSNGSCWMAVCSAMLSRFLPETRVSGGPQLHLQRRSRDIRRTLQWWSCNRCSEQLYM